VAIIAGPIAGIDGGLNLDVANGGPPNHAPLACTFRRVFYANRVSGCGPEFMFSFQPVFLIVPIYFAVLFI
jgi:hypothetical protein